MTSQTVSDTIQPDLREFKAIAAEVEGWLAQRLEACDWPANLREAVSYSLLGPGKRLRPVLTVLSCEAVGGDRTSAMPAAAALELVHCFSLVHDDLPAMDDDDMRRGRPTLHKHAGEAMAILAGDAMLALAFEWLSHADTPPMTQGRLFSELSGATLGMICGQVLDTLGGFADGLDERTKLDLIHHNKTGALIRAACRMGALSGGADDVALKAITAYGEATGLMFQIVDDLLDVTQSSEHLGKAAGKDETAGKRTFPGLIGIDASQREVKKQHQAAHAALQPLGDAARPLLDLCDYMAVRTK